jgi:CheY-like chemotaxis protein
VLEAHSAAEALKLLMDGALVDLVITDHAMPDMTGLELARGLTQTHPQLRVILATGYADVPQGQGLPNLPRLSKPFVQDELDRLLIQVGPGDKPVKVAPRPTQKPARRSRAPVPAPQIP